jgi:hypothetical protein
MAKFLSDTILDTALNYLKNNVTQMAVCSQQPADLTGAVTTYKLALKTGLNSSSFTGPANGDTNGRKLTTNVQTSVAVDTGGTATHVAWCSASELLFVTTCTSQVLTSGNTLTIPAHKVEMGDIA